MYNVYLKGLLSPYSIRLLCRDIDNAHHYIGAICTILNGHRRWHHILPQRAEKVNKPTPKIQDLFPGKSVMLVRT